MINGIIDAIIFLIHTRQKVMEYRVLFCRNYRQLQTGLIDLFFQWYLYRDISRYLHGNLSFVMIFLFLQKSLSRRQLSRVLPTCFLRCAGDLQLCDYECRCRLSDYLRSFP